MAPSRSAGLLLGRHNWASLLAALQAVLGQMIDVFGDLAKRRGGSCPRPPGIALGRSCPSMRRLVIAGADLISGLRVARSRAGLRASFTRFGDISGRTMERLSDVKEHFERMT